MTSPARATPRRRASCRPSSTGASTTALAPGHSRTRLESVTTSNLDPGPLLQRRVGDRLRVHFKNLDTLARAALDALPRRPVPAGLGRRLRPGFSGRDGDVMPGQTWTYRLTAAPTRRACGPTTTTRRRCTSRSPAGCSGCSRSSAATSARRDREFVVVFSPMGIPGDRRPRVRRQHARLRVARRRARPVGRDGEGSDHHTFHVHGHRWLTPTAPARQQTVGPAESFRIRWREGDPGTWLYHCHVEEHMEGRDDRHLPGDAGDRRLGTRPRRRAGRRPRRRSGGGAGARRDGGGPNSAAKLTRSASASTRSRRSTSTCSSATPSRGRTRSVRVPHRHGGRQLVRRARRQPTRYTEPAQGPSPTIARPITPTCMCTRPTTPPRRRSSSPWTCRARAPTGCSSISSTRASCAAQRSPSTWPPARRAGSSAGGQRSWRRLTPPASTRRTVRWS